MAAILNQPWEDVADDVTGAIEKAVQPLLKKAVDDIYGGLLDATQDYLRDNLAFNIASRINAAEQQALRDRQELAREKQKAEALLEALDRLTQWEGHHVYCGHGSDDSRPCVCGFNAAYDAARAAISLAKGESA